MAKNDGGPAMCSRCGAPLQLDLRDWFAGQALPVFLSSEGLSAVAKGRGLIPTNAAARAAYEAADAMLAERSKNPEEPSQ